MSERDVHLRVFPRAAVRDALGLVRLLWLGEHERTSVDPDGDPSRAVALLAIGRALAEVLLRGSLPPGSARCAAAQEEAGRVMDCLVELAWEGEARFLVSAARDRIRTPTLPADDRELKRRARRERG